MSDLMSQGLNLALYGMGTVFFFLTLLVVATMLMSVLVPTELEEIEPQGRLDPKIRAAIGAAIHQHRQRKNE